MIQTFVNRFINKKVDILAEIEAKPPTSYDDLVNRVIEALVSDADCPRMDPSRLTIIDHGDYQGTRLYIIGAEGYQPSTYWSIFVNYGSCSGCDTFEAIRNYSDEPLTDRQMIDYWALMLHMVQNIKEV